MATYNAEVYTPPAIIEATKDARSAEINNPPTPSVPQVITPGTRVIRR